MMCTLIVGTVNYMMSYTGAPLPDQAWIIYDYGDGTVTAPVAFNPTHSHSYAYATHGHYVTTITLYNDASESTRQIAVSVFHPLD